MKTDNNSRIKHSVKQRIIALFTICAVILEAFAGCTNTKHGNYDSSKSDYLIEEDIETTENDLRNNGVKEYPVLEEIDYSKHVKPESICEIERNVSINYENQEDCYDMTMGYIYEGDIDKALRGLEELNNLIELGNTYTNEWLSKQEEDINTYISDLSDNARGLVNYRRDIFRDEFEEAIETENKKINSIIDCLNANDIELAKKEYEELGIQLCLEGEQSYGISNDLDSYSVQEISYLSKNLAGSIDIEICDEVKELADDLESPVNVYNYLKNSINFEYYYGAKKGAKTTLESMAGNDYDQASLLISILRYMGYHAEYVRGIIQINEAQALSLTGADTIEIAANILSSAGVPVTKIKRNGKVEKLKLEHVWVRAEIPYTNYRGARPGSGELVWVDLDTSIKNYEKSKTISDVVEDKYAEDFFGRLETKRDKEEIYEFTEYTINQIRNENFDNLSVMSRNIENDYICYLPLSLQYDVVQENETFSEINNDYKDLVSFYFDGSILGTLSSTDIIGKNVQLFYEPASTEDKEIAGYYKSIFDMPADLISFVPVLYVDGEAVFKGDDNFYRLGRQYSFSIRMDFKGNVPVNQKIINNIVTIGSMYAITFDPQTITPNELGESYDRIYDVARTIDGKKEYSINCLGEYLSFVGKLYFSELDNINRLASDSLNVEVTRRLSEGITGYEVSRSVSNGNVVGILPGNLFIDIDSNDTIAVSRNANEQDVKIFNVYSGYTSSIYESKVWEQLTGIESVSTISVFEKARVEGVEISSISIDCISDIDNLDISSNLKQELKNQINAGNTIIIPRKEVIIGSWKGSGYVLINGADDSMAFMISGGLNGGVVPEEVAPQEYIKAELSIDEHIMILTTEITATMSAMMLIAAVQSTSFAVIFPYESKVIVSTVQVTAITSIALLQYNLIRYMTTGEQQYFANVQDMLMMLSILSLTDSMFADYIYSMYMPVSLEPEKIPESAKNYTNPETDLDNGFEELNTEVYTLKLEKGTWEKGFAVRGDNIDVAAGNNLGHNFPTFDNFDEEKGVATSVKSRNTLSPTYQKAGKLESTTKADIDNIIKFDNTKDFTWNKKSIYAGDIKERRLELVLPNEQLSKDQINGLNNAIKYGETNGVKVIVIIGDDK